MKAITPESKELVARKFSFILAKWLTVADMRQIVYLNSTPEYGGDVCASHDFCDANEAIYEALRALDLAPKADDPAWEEWIQKDETIALWGEAWDIAKANRFYSKYGGRQ